MGLDHEESGANVGTIDDVSIPALSMKDNNNGLKDVRKPKLVDVLDPIDALSPHERSPDASGLKRSACAMMGDARHIDRPCDKKIKREESIPPLRRLRRHDRMLSPLDVANVTQLRQHLCDVRREKFLRPMVSIVTRLMFHKYNHGIFNVRVDPVKWNIPHYFEIVKNPMDLTLVKTKCLNLEYETADECAGDITLVFSNACLFNPPGHMIHECAKLLAHEFQVEYNRCKAKFAAQAKRREEHSCPSCLANVCGICNEKCINFEPPLVMCSGPCRQRIKRHSVYYKTSDRMYFWCAKCYTGLPKVIMMKNQFHRVEDTKIPKQSLVKAKFIDELTEPWVQCDECSGWVHQICALFNTCENAETGDEEIPYMCPLCRLKHAEAQVSTWTNLEIAPSETSVDEFPVAVHSNSLRSPFSSLPTHVQPSKEFTRALGLGDDGVHKRVFDFLDVDEAHAVAMAAASDEEQIPACISSTMLKSTPLSTFMQDWVRRFCESLDEPEVANSIVIKVASSIKASCTVSSIVRESMNTEANQYPEKMDYISKAIFVFQKMNGVEVCIFSMYVQEYDETAIVKDNRKRVYLAYIDSLVYMRPRHMRTALFHEILISYFGFSKLRGFEYAHIWACPTTRGGDFIYWCHPSFQKNPGKDRLLEWYTAMANKARNAGVAFSCDDLYTTDFEQLEAQLDQQLPPYFDGDYWPSEVERLQANPPKRGKLNKEAYEESLRGVKFRKRLVESVRLSRGSLFVIALQPKCSMCFTLMINSEYWLLADGSGEKLMCDSCHQSASSIGGIKVPLPSFVKAFTSVKDTEITCPFLDRRADMLKNCEERHYQFDSFRRAKYSTMMLIYHIMRTQRGLQPSEG